MMNRNAFKFDHVQAISKVEEAAEFGEHVPRAMKLAFLYGAKAAMLHGDIPQSHLTRLDSLIAFYEKNRDVDGHGVEGMKVGEQETQDSRS